MKEGLRVAVFCFALLVGPSYAATVSLFQGRVTFEPPAGLARLTARQLKSEFPGDGDLRYAFTNGKNTESVLVYVPDVLAGDAELERIKGFVERTQHDYSGWITSELIFLDKRRWFHFEWEKPPPSELESLIAPSEPKRNLKRKPEPQYFNEYTTSFNGQPLRFVFQSTGESEPKIKARFEKSAATIRISDQT